MTDESLILQLLETALDSNCPPEEVCKDHPHLLHLVQKHWERCCRIEAEINTLLPPADEEAGSGYLPVSQQEESLPEVPGYRLLSVLGHGGMGIVFKAMHVRLNRVIAMKMLLTGAFATRTERERFLQEARAIAGLQHPHIVQVFDVGEFDGRPFFTMEFVDGMTLANDLAGMPQSVARTVALIRTLAETIELAHRNGVIHRDLKPANILLTAEGMPKISDFGVARRLDDDRLLTFTGTRVGTPCYMAPEQLWGNADAIGRPADIYSLGALMYQLLTGRPPFQGESPAETQRLLLEQEAVPPSRINQRIPRDVETICLKCLEKIPARRYQTAKLLSEDLGRFERGEPITASRTGVTTRLVKWLRRHPSAATAFAGATILLALLISATIWIIASRQATNRAVQEDLRETVRWQQQSSWSNAEAALNRAAIRLSSSGPSELRAEFLTARHDSDLAAKLNNIRFTRATSSGGALNLQEAVESYSAEFDHAGIGKLDEDPATVGKKVHDSNIRDALITALDDWSFSYALLKQHLEDRDWVMSVALHADHDPSAWRDKVRDPIVWMNGKSLHKAVDNAPVMTQPPAFLVAVACQLQLLGQDSVPFLRHVVLAHPSDFWVNFVMASVMEAKSNWPDTIRYYQAAVALDPDSAILHHNLGTIQQFAGNYQEAVDQLREAIRLDPTAAVSHNNLGLSLGDLHCYDEALVELREAARERPDVPDYVLTIGEVLATQGKFDEALSQYRHAVALQPRVAFYPTQLSRLLQKSGRSLEVLAAWKHALDENSKNYADWDTFAESCLFSGDIQDYESTRRSLLRNFGDSTNLHVCEQAGRACILLPGTTQELDRATAMIDRLVAVKKTDPAWVYDFYLLAKGLAEYRAGRFESAISIVEGKAGEVLPPVPKLIEAMAVYRLGHADKAQSLLASAVISYDWSPLRIDSREIQICHIIRREAEQTILQDFNEILQGNRQPSTNDQRLALTGIYQFRQLNLRRARLWIDAFGADPKLAENHRFDAATAAAQAMLGVDTDPIKMTDYDRLRFTKQIYNWFSDDLDFCDTQLRRNFARNGYCAILLSKWLTSPDFKPFQDSAGLKIVNSADRTAWDLLWVRADALLALSKKTDSVDPQRLRE